MHSTTTKRALLALAISLATQSGALAQSDDGTGFVPGAQFERKLPGGGGYVCTATNTLRSQQCSVSCPSRDEADCEDAEGGGAPVCQCSKG